MIISHNCIAGFIYKGDTNLYPHPFIWSSIKLCDFKNLMLTKQLFIDTLNVKKIDAQTELFINNKATITHINAPCISINGINIVYPHHRDVDINIVKNQFIRRFNRYNSSTQNCYIFDETHYFYKITINDVINQFINTIISPNDLKILITNNEYYKQFESNTVKIIIPDKQYSVKDLTIFLYNNYNTLIKKYI